MPKHSPVVVRSLTPYESAQVAEIAVWKGASSGLTKRVLRTVTKPLGNLMNMVIPKKPVQAAIEAVNKMAGQLSQDDSIFNDEKLKAKGIQTLEALREQPLEFADELAESVIKDADNIALGMGAATGTGGPIAAAAGMPVLVAGALRVIYRVSQAYGYAIDHPGHKELMLHILALSTATDPEERAKAMENYQKQIETTFLHQAVEESTQNALQKAVLGVELGVLIPGFSIVLSAYLNREFVHRAGIAAKRVFQENWLRERHKVTWIEPA